MGINIRVQKSPKPLDVIEVEAKLKRDLRSCMRCRFFYGNNRQSERYCFPCMKKLLGIEEKEHEKEIVFEQEEKKDG